MFSFGDLKLLADSYNDVDPRRIDEFVYMLVCKDPTTGNAVTYALKVNDIEALKNQVYNIWNNPKYAVPSTGNTKKDDDDKMVLIHKDQAKTYDKNRNDLEKSFLQQFGGLGSSLYKASDDSLQNWDKLENASNPDPTSTNTLIVTKKPCN
jgi:hypothetical protein